MDRAAVHAFGVLDTVVAGCIARKMDEASLRTCLLYMLANTINEPFSFIIQTIMLVKILPLKPSPLFLSWLLFGVSL